MANWNNRIIVTTFVLTLLASGVMVIQRATRDRADDRRSAAPESAENDLEPVPSHRINRQSFQADSRSGESNDLKRKQSSNRPTHSTARIGADAGSDSAYNEVPVSYDGEIQSAQASDDQFGQDTYDLSVPSTSQHDHNIGEPRSLRMRSR
jgi:hypothetical protein